MNLFSKTWCFLAIVELPVKETWKIQAATEEYSKSHLPDMAESSMHEILPLLKQVIVTDYAGDIDLFAMEKLRASILQSLQGLLCAFRVGHLLYR